MANASLPAGDASFRQLLSYVRLHSKAILEQFAPDDFCLAILDEQDGTGLVAEARALAALRVFRERLGGLCGLGAGAVHRQPQLPLDGRPRRRLARSARRPRHDPL